MNTKRIKRILVTVGITAGLITVTAGQASAGHEPQRADAAHPVSLRPVTGRITAPARIVVYRGLGRYRHRLALGHAAAGDPEHAVLHARRAAANLERGRADLEHAAAARGPRHMPVGARTLRCGVLESSGRRPRAVDASAPGRAAATQMWRRGPARRLSAAAAAVRRLGARIEASELRQACGEDLEDRGRVLEVELRPRARGWRLLAGRGARRALDRRRRRGRGRDGCRYRPNPR